MLARIRKALSEEEGFTLIELLVVMIIIGILAAIAIPVFLNQRENAYDSAVKSDLRNAATEVESQFVTNQAYPATGTDLTATAIGVKTSAGVRLSYTLDSAAGTFCIDGTNSNGGHAWSYDSGDAGLGAADETCASR